MPSWADAPQNIREPLTNGAMLSRPNARHPASADDQIRYVCTHGHRTNRRGDPKELGEGCGNDQVESKRILANLGGMLCSSQAILEPSWTRMTYCPGQGTRTCAILSHLESTLGQLSWTCLVCPDHETQLCNPGAIMQPSWAILSPPWTRVTQCPGNTRRSCAILRRFWSRDILGTPCDAQCMQHQTNLPHPEAIRNWSWAILGIATTGLIVAQSSGIHPGPILGIHPHLAISGNPGLILGHPKPSCGNPGKLLGTGFTLSHLRSSCDHPGPPGIIVSHPEPSRAIPNAFWFTVGPTRGILEHPVPVLRHLG